MLKIKIGLLVCFCSILILSCTKDLKIIGQVIDPSTGKGIANVTVSYQGYKSGLTKTNGNGSYTIDLKGKSKKDEILVYLDESVNSNLTSTLFFPSNKSHIIRLNEELDSPDFHVFEYIDGNLVMKDKTIVGPANYDFLEYTIFSKDFLEDNRLTNKRINSFINGQVLTDRLHRGKMFIAGKVHYSDGTKREFYDSTIVPKSVVTSYSWTVNF